MWKIKRNKSDILFSEWQRKLRNGVCERCRRNVGYARLQVSHYHGRRKQSVRFDPLNISVICFSCHRFFTENPLDHTEWFKNRLGEKEFKKLTIRANTPQKHDEKLICLYISQQLKKLK